MTTQAGSRRQVLVGAAAFAGLAGLPEMLNAAGKAIAGHVPANVPTAATLGGWLKQLHDFGPVRHTGTPQCRAFEEFLATEFGKLGCEVKRDQFRLMSWACSVTDCSITIAEDGGAKKTLDVVAYYPFSATTKGKPAVTGRVIYGGVGDKSGKDILAAHSAADLAKSIVVVEMPLAGGGVRGHVEFFPGTLFPDNQPPYYYGPNPAAQGGKGVMDDLEGKCLGLILCYTDVSNDACRHNILPFSDGHRQIPGLWIGHDDTQYLKGVAGKATATMRLDATLVPDARADSFLCILKGQTDEVVYLTTQTDGPNECNENGGIGLLASATYMSKIKNRKRTFAFSLPTGHYAAGAVRDKVTGSGRPAGTTGNMAKWPEYIDRCVAQIAMEQMAAMEWTAADMGWKPTGFPAPENWIPTPDPDPSKTFNPMFMACANGGDPKNAREGLVKSGQAPGEGGALRNRKLPGVGLMGSPQYFFRADPKGVLEKVNPNVMHNQVLLVTKLMTLMDRLTVGQLKGTEAVTDKDLYG